MIVNLSMFQWALSSGHALDDAMTVTFATLICIEFFKAYAFRSDRHSIIRGMFSNKWLNIAILWEVVLMLLIIYVPFLQIPFKTFPLTWDEWAIILPAAASVIPVLELAKWMERRGIFGKMA